MNKINEKITTQQKNIQNLEQQFVDIKKKHKKLGIIIPCSIFALFTLLIAPYIRYESTINPAEQFLILISNPVITCAMGAGIIGLFKDREKEISGKIETAKAILNYEKNEQEKERKKINEKVNEKYKELCSEQKESDKEKITVVENSTLQQLRKAKLELMQEQNKKTYVPSREQSKKVKTLTKPFYNK